MLRYDRRNPSFFLITNDSDKAEECGLTLSKRAKGPNGEAIYFTADYDGNPEFNPYAVLSFYDEADSLAREILDPLYRDYMASWADSSIEDFPRPSGKEYLGYQKAGIRYALARGNALIGDEMGLGKTVQAIGVANTIGAKRILVVCPASIRLNWVREIRNWSTIPNVLSYPMLKGSDGLGSGMVNYVVTSYELAKTERVHNALCSNNWDLLILDEAHYLKSPNATRTRAVFGGGRGLFSRQNLAKVSKRIIALTGTPLPNRPRECYTLARGLCPESIDFMSQESFTYRFNPSARLTTGHNIEKQGRLPELQSRLRCNFMVRRNKKEVLKDLPRVTYEINHVEQNGSIRSVLAKERLLDFDPELMNNPNFSIDGQISTVRREMGEAKAPRVIESVKYLMEVEELPKLVLFFHHRSVGDIMMQELSQYGIVCIRGGVSATAKQEAVESFIINSNTRIFMGQLDAAGFGIDGLQKVCSRVVFAEPAWTPGTNQQCIDRLWRFGQQESVIAQFLVAEGSLDERVLNAVLVKVHDIHGALDGGVRIVR